MKSVKPLYIICSVLVVLILLVMIIGCPTSNEPFKNKKKELSAEEFKVVEMLQENASDEQIKEYMTKNIKKFKNKETFANIMDALAENEDDKNVSSKKKKSVKTD